MMKSSSIDSFLSFRAQPTSSFFLSFRAKLSSSFCHSERSDETHPLYKQLGMSSLVAAKAALSG